MTRWLVRFGYDGLGFVGWARQPGRRTIEGVLRERLGRSSPRGPVTPISLEVASRTDRGVSAVGNALVVDSRLDGASLLRQLNGVSPDIFCSAATPVDATFRVRRAVRRVYRYFEPDRSADLSRWRDAADLLTGALDVRSFGRGIPAEGPQWRTVEQVTVSPLVSGLMVEVRAPSFVWGMVRKMVGAMREHHGGRLPLGRLKQAVDGKLRLTLPLAEPEGLVLWDVEFPVTWAVRWNGPNRYQLALVERERSRTWVRSRVLESLRSEGTTSDAPDP